MKKKLIGIGSFLMMLLLNSKETFAQVGGWGQVPPQSAGGAGGGGTATGMWRKGLDLSGEAGLPQTKFSDALTGVLNFTTMLLAGLGVLGFLISGILYITATGDEERMQLGKRGMMYSAIGIAVGALGYVIVQTMVAIMKNEKGAF
ncbi:MAG: hypothetical protein GF335_04355 [Candidatus Moranbacteria bacterium]|nr:hypothetical protein [Candidatus Moranbacteria bacterium]